MIRIILSVLVIERKQRTLGDFESKKRLFVRLLPKNRKEKDEKGKKSKKKKREKGN